MAYSILPAPGTELGPCETNCQHRDCAETRRMAETRCFICGEPIGYDQAFLNDSHKGRGLYHFRCEDELN